MCLILLAVDGVTLVVTILPVAALALPLLSAALVAQVLPSQLVTLAVVRQAGFSMATAALF